MNELTFMDSNAAQLPVTRPDIRVCATGHGIQQNALAGAGNDAGLTLAISITLVAQ